MVFFITKKSICNMQDVWLLKLKFLKKYLAGLLLISKK